MSSLPKPDALQSDPAYLQDLQKYPYLLNSFCRKPKVYESPYAIGGGYTSKYQPLELQKQADGYDSRTLARHTPSNSVSSQSRRASQQWTPPSQVWDRAGLAERHKTPPPSEQQQQQQYQHSVPPSQRYVPVSHSTPQEFQRQIQGSMPSTASRDGAHARMLRDQGYIPANTNASSMYASAPIYQQRNSFGNVYDTSKMYNSPKAPTPSPLSDNNTPGYGRGHTPTNSGISGNSNLWGTLSQSNNTIMANPMSQNAQQNAMRERPPGAGFGYNPTLPQMGGGNGLGGHETWRYN